MTAYNRQEFIKEAIDSVLKNTYQNWELIIVDDCSIDDTFNIARSYADHHPNIFAHRNDRNLGDYPNRNKAVSYAKGEFIVYVDSDDWIFKNSLVEWVPLMISHKCSFAMFNNVEFLKPTLLDAKESIQQHFFVAPILMNGPGATMTATSYFKAINGFPEKYGPANDMYFNLKAASRTSTLFIPTPIGDYRRHAGQEINNHYSYLYNNFRYLRDGLSELDLNLNARKIAYLGQKNKRRFLVNCVKYFIKYRNLSKTIAAISMAGFTVKDFFEGVFNKKIDLK